MLRHARSVLNSARLLSASELVSFTGLGLSTSAVSQGPAPPDNGWLPPEAYFYERQLPSHDKYCRQRNIVPIGPRYPAIAQNAYIAPSAVVIGDVDVLDSVSVMHGSVVRGDLNNIKIGYYSTIQENCVIHAARQPQRVKAHYCMDSCSGTTCRSGPTGLPAATFIGEAVTVGAGSLLRSCRIHEQTVIGERCIIMEGSVVDAMTVLEPGTVVPPAKYIPSGEVWGGCPARFVRKLTHDEVSQFALVWAEVQETEIAHLTDSHEKYRHLYGAEELPFGNLWKDAERVDPAEDRIHPEGLPPDWACHPLPLEDPGVSEPVPAP